jgi:hypothetical protein
MAAPPATSQRPGSRYGTLALTCGERPAAQARSVLAGSTGRATTRSALRTGIAFLVVGGMRSRVVDQAWWRSAPETLMVGGFSRWQAALARWSRAWHVSSSITRTRPRAGAIVIVRCEVVSVCWWPGRRTLRSTRQRRRTIGRPQPARRPWRPAVVTAEGVESGPAGSSEACRHATRAAPGTPAPPHHAGPTRSRAPPDGQTVSRIRTGAPQTAAPHRRDLAAGARGVSPATGDIPARQGRARGTTSTGIWA